MNPLFEPTYSVAELCGEVRALLGEAFASVWVAGEVQRARLHARGHFYFELIEKGERDEIVGKLDAVIWKTDFQKVRRLLASTGQDIAEGLEVRCRGNLDFYAPAGKIQLCVREVDPVFTLGLLEMRRRETLAALTAAGLLERNRSLPFPELPLKLALITSHGSAAFHDFVSCLRESGYGFQVLLFHVAVQGKDAERDVVSALAALAGLPVDCAVLIRGGGSRTDLAVFDARAIAEAIARAPFPVLTGLGHEIDQSIADLVAHTATKTPTQAAELLINRVRRAEQAVDEVQRRLLREAFEPLRRGREALGRAERGLAVARLKLAGTEARLDELARALGRLGKSALREARRDETDLAGRLAAAARRGLARASADRRTLAERLAAAGRGRLREVEARLDGLSRLATELAPERTLSRGFSITRILVSQGAGPVLRHPAEAAPGDLVETRLAGGSLRSRVEIS